jgi:hypothetical protein
MSRTDRFRTLSVIVGLAILALAPQSAGAASGATLGPHAANRAADRAAREFLRDVGPQSSIAALPSGPCMALDARSALCRIAVLIRVQVTAEGATEPWRCEAYVLVVRRQGDTATRRGGADCRPAAGAP